MDLASLIQTYNKKDDHLNGWYVPIRLFDAASIPFSALLHSLLNVFVTGVIHVLMLGVCFFHFSHFELLQFFLPWFF